MEPNQTTDEPETFDFPDDAEEGQRIRPGELGRIYKSGLYTVSTTVPLELRARVDAAAKARGISRAVWLSEAIEAHLDAEDRLA